MCIRYFDEFFPCLFQVWCPTPLTPCVGEWWWLPVPPSNTRVQWTVLFKLSRVKVSCPWWRELVSWIIVYGLTYVITTLFSRIFLFLVLEGFFLQVKSFHLKSKYTPKSQDKCVCTHKKIRKFCCFLNLWSWNDWIHSMNSSDIFKYLQFCSVCQLKQIFTNIL